MKSNQRKFFNTVFYINVDIPVGKDVVYKDLLKKINCYTTLIRANISPILTVFQLLIKQEGRKTMSFKLFMNYKRRRT